MILSDRDIRAALDAGRVVIEPLADSAIRPSSVDLRADGSFLVFANHRYPYIDVRAEQPELTELVKVDEDEPFILHPGEFVLGSTYERVTLPDDLVSRLEGKSSLGRLGLLVHATAGFRRSGILGQPHPRAVERREPADRDLPADEDRPARLLPPVQPRAAAVRDRRARQQVHGPARAHREPVLENFRGEDRSPIALGGTQDRPGSSPSAKRRRDDEQGAR